MSSSSRRPVPWVEKYRPRKVEDVASQFEVVAALQETMQSGNLPHMLFYGPPGTGKTSTILAACKQLFGPDLLKSRVLELNASDDRGIDMVRNKVKGFASASVGRPPAGYEYPCPPFKVIILDEADAMTSSAQTALRRIIEQHSRVTRFCILCNYVSKIIHPLLSRCAKFRFKPLEESITLERLHKICDLEGVDVTEETLQTLVGLTEGDLRRAINVLHSASIMYGSSLDSAGIVEVMGIIPAQLLNDFFEACTRTHACVQRAVQQIMRNGFSALQMVSQLVDFVVELEEGEGVTDIQKAKIACELGAVEKRLQDGADERLQLLEVGSFIKDTLQ